MNSIIPISANMPPIGGVKNNPAQTEAAKGFTDYLKDAVNNIEELDRIKSEDAYLLSIGELDDIAAMQINGQKFDVAVQMMVQMRNRLMDSYSEIMRMNI